VEFPRVTPKSKKESQNNTEFVTKLILPIQVVGWYFTLVHLFRNSFFLRVPPFWFFSLPLFGFGWEHNVVYEDETITSVGMLTRTSTLKKIY
jgi:hypothetical protein